MSEVIEYPAPDFSLVTPPDSAWERERRAFRNTPAPSAVQFRHRKRPS
jgi:hypothetical protein